MTLHVLALAEFDPAGVVLSHRDALALAGSVVVEMRVALRDARTPRQMQADWIGNVAVGSDGSGGVKFAPGDSPTALHNLFVWADVVQLHPGISQDLIPDDAAYLLGWLAGEPAARVEAKTNPTVVSFVHGSRRMWDLITSDHRLVHEEHIAASTLDYAATLKTRSGKPVAWLPPWIPDVYGRAGLRREGDPLVIAHTPTDPGNCGTHALTEWIRGRYPAVRLRFQHGAPHLQALTAKLGANAGFDHLRGAFSVNALECAMLGLDTYCVLRPKYVAVGEAQGLRGNFFPPTAEQVFDTMAESLADWRVTAARQQQMRTWFGVNFSLAATVQRLERFYGGLR